MTIMQIYINGRTNKRQITVYQCADFLMQWIVSMVLIYHIRHISLERLGC